MSFNTFNMLALLALVFLPAAPLQADEFVRDDIITRPSPSAFSVCYDYDCASLARLSLAADQWNSIRHLFTPSAATPELERKLIARAIAQFETLSGEMTGTDRDIGGSFPAIGKEGQMDCIDESTNTTTYLRILAATGSLKWHAVEDRASRGLFIFQWPHSSAVIRDTRSGVYYAVDSWFHDNGRTPEIIRLDTWKRGWKP